MRNIKMTLAFRGTAYHGWQVQRNALSVCTAFQDALEQVLGKRYDVKGCSRTDAGVHARGFVLSVLCPGEDAPSIPCEALQKAMNNALPRDMAVLDCADVPWGFHPRYDCLGKRYRYEIWNSPVKNPFLEDLAYHYRPVVDVRLADAAAKAFQGTWDFSTLCAAGGSVEEKVRTIFSCGVERQGDLVVLSVTGDGFLYNMVRILAGTLIQTGLGAYAPEDMAGILEACDRQAAGPTAPAKGLTLVGMRYPEYPELG